MDATPIGVTIGSVGAAMLIAFVGVAFRLGAVLGRISGASRGYPAPSPGCACAGRPRRKGRGRFAFGWYGGKFSHLAWLLPLLPEANHDCGPFDGSAAVLLNRTPAKVETHNDIDGQVTTFFRALREHTDELIRQIALTPFSREEFLSPVSTKLTCRTRSVRRFFVRARQVRTGLAQTESVGRWANCKQTSRAGMSGVVSRWLGSIDSLPEIAERLLRIQIVNRPAVDVIRLYDDAHAALPRPALSA